MIKFKAKEQGKVSPQRKAAEQLLTQLKRTLEHEQSFQNVRNPLPDVVALKAKQPERLLSLARRLERRPEIKAVRPSAAEIHRRQCHMTNPNTMARICGRRHYENGMPSGALNPFPRNPSGH